MTTNALVAPEQTAQARVVVKGAGTLAGIDVAGLVFKSVDSEVRTDVFVSDGSSVVAGETVAIVVGSARAILSAERVALNFLQRLSGIATTTSRYVRAIKGTKAKIYDTRKTLPGWRLLEKYAVRCGGGYNHRLGLYDGILVKDNHLAELGGDFTKRLQRLVADARKVKGLQFVAVEVDHVDNQLNYVLKIPGIDIVLLDNMGQWQLKHAVEMRDKMCGKHKGPLLEASGNITLNNVSEIAQCGVDRIAVGAITHSAAAVDIGLDR